MFTGIITAIGEVKTVTPIGDGRDMRLEIATPPGFLAQHGGTAIGASIACSGCCLTVISLSGETFAVEVSAETLARTALSTWGVGTRMNLERSARLGDEMGGHIVSGHVDGLGRIAGIEMDQGSLRITIAVPRGLARFIAEKGSVAVDGVSLTVNGTARLAGNENFWVNIIPHTATHTTLGARQIGDSLHIEIDMLARYAARLAEFDH
jgi:riboflavin synthase